MKMRICFLSREYPPEHHIGGIATFTSNMARALTKLGHDVSVITATTGKGTISRENGIRVSRIPYRKIIPKELAYLIYSYSVRREISKFEKGIDVICCPEFYSDAFLYSYFNRAPLITRLATPLCIAQKYQKNGYLRGRPFFKWMEKKQVLNSNAIFTSTKALAQSVREEWNLKNLEVEIIPNSIDLDRVNRLANGSYPEDKVPWSEYMVFFGRLEERKGVHIIADALPRIFRIYPNVFMVFVGADTNYSEMSMKDYIKSRLTAEFQQRVLFLGNLSQKELFPIVKHARLVILPSLWEGFGFVSIEAMALGKVVIATRGSGFDEIIEDQQSGFLVPPGESEALGERILYCLANRHEMVRIEQNVAKRAKYFDVYHTAERLSDYFARVLNQSNKP